MADPSLEVRPDFEGNLYEDIRNDLIAATGATVEESGIDTQEEEERLAKEVETENEHLEAEKKKPKMNGFITTASVGDSIAPRPSQYAIQKLNNFEYVELWYFSPEGCKEAMKTSRSIADDMFSLTKLDNHLSIRPSSTFKASRSALPDHELMFSTFLRAKNLFLTHANMAKWPQTHLDALVLFFWHLKNHAIRNNSEIGDMVILHYASCVHLNWHDQLKRDEGFNIGIINETLLRTINEEIWDQIRSKTLLLKLTKKFSLPNLNPLSMICTAPLPAL
ncbi:hypothetical protein BD769DRAFT_1676888 [Suillus cothurnatus]|nr:hypothetical protein BD769DRAFT_1676888 [Suillus cothurnatus]